MVRRPAVFPSLCALFVCVLVSTSAIPAQEEGACSECSECVERLLAEIEGRGWLGMALHLHGDERLDGLEVQFLDRRGPAAQAGVQEGDRVVKMQGLELGKLSAEEIVTLLRGFEPGDRVTLELVRDGEARELSLRARRMDQRARAEALGAYFIRQRARQRPTP